MVKSKIKLFTLFLVLILLISGCTPKDTSPPQVSIITPQNGETVSGVVTIKVQANDNVGVKKIEFYIDNVRVGEDTTSPYEYSWDTTQVNNGTHIIMVKAIDSVGNNFFASIDVVVDNPWQKTFGGTGEDVAVSIQQTSDGGYIVAGWINSFGAGGYDAYLIKLNANGDLVWQKTFGGSEDDWASSIQQTSDGGYIVAGGTKSFGAGDSDVYIIKLDANGNLVWQKTFGGSDKDGAVSIQQTNDGGYIVAGYTGSFGAGDYDVYILKLDANGNLVWQKTFGGSSWDITDSFQQTSDGGYIVAGWTSSFGAGGSDVYILKLDANGNLVWQKTFGGSSLDFAVSIQQTSDGGYIVAGYTFGYTFSFEAGSFDIYILKLDADGNSVWQKTFGGSGDDRGYSIQQTSDGGYIVAGGTLSFGAGGVDVYILKLDSNGNLVWQKTFGGSEDDWASSIQQTSDGGYIVAGYTSSYGAGGGDVYILKLDENGNTGPYPTK